MFPEATASLEAPFASALAEVVASLQETLACLHVLHLPGARDRHRDWRNACIDRAERMLALDSPAGEVGVELARLRKLVIQAHAVRAEDARYGAGQLSRGAQRAPTEQDCEEGWRRVEAIVAAAEHSAIRARSWAHGLSDFHVDRAVRAATASSRQARQLLDERNHAYTFHTSPSFSFGEGWYLAAAAVLFGVAIQIEPDQPYTEQARVFLEDAGLGERLVPYRPRPRANKALPALIARAFREDPIATQAKLRSAFLGGQVMAQEREIGEFTHRRLAEHSGRRTVLVWVRCGAHQSTRNSTQAEIEALCRLALTAELTPILIGDGLRDGDAPLRSVDLTLFWKRPLFQGLRMRRAQLLFFECLRRSYGLVGQMGVTTAGMDGPALLGLKTMYLTDEPNVRLGTWVGAVPGYQEIIRTERYLDKIGRRLAAWGSEGSTGARCDTLL